MPVYALLLEYDGAEFHGWQRQENHPTIQQTLQHALQIFLRCPRIPITGSGRTDTGVHARGQVAHFTCDEIPQDLAQRMVHALNGLLPASIAIHAVTKMPDNFHARYDARLRTYHYHISTTPLALERNRRLYVANHLDFEQMNQASRLLIGTKHFGAFCRTQSATINRICTVSTAQWDLEAPLGYWKFVIEADRFLHGMVRSLAGTLMEIGRGYRSAQDLDRILESQDRREAGAAAPAHALVLDRVLYSESLFENR